MNSRRMMDLERFKIAGSGILMVTHSEIIHDNVLIYGREERKRQRERERDSTLIPGFSVHMYTDALFLTLSNILSHHTDTEGECVCVCVCVIA